MPSGSALRSPGLQAHQGAGKQPGHALNTLQTSFYPSGVGVTPRPRFAMRTIRDFRRARVLASVLVAWRGGTPSAIILLRPTVRGHLFCTFSCRRRVRAHAMAPGHGATACFRKVGPPPGSQGPVYQLTATCAHAALLHQDFVACSQSHGCVRRCPVLRQGQNIFNGLRHQNDL